MAIRKFALNENTVSGPVIIAVESYTLNSVTGRAIAHIACALPMSKIYRQLRTF
jgi:hypothetical protein